MNTYRFGFLTQKATYRFTGGRITPAPQFAENKKWIARYMHEDGFLYPPLVVSKSGEGERVANTARPSHLHRVPASHDLLIDVGALPNDHDRPNATVVIQLIAYLHGTCLQFEDWWLDSRVPLRNAHNIHFSSQTAENFLSHGYETWQKWKVEVRRRFTNTLFMLNRAPTYQWDWEHFVHEYMVLDACHKTAEDLGFVKSGGSHGKRIQQLCEAFGLQQNPDLARETVRLRNDLFHETLWDHVQPGTASSASSLYAPLHLRRFNQRLVLAILGYHSEYMRSSWWSMSPCVFSIPK